MIVGFIGMILDSTSSSTMPTIDRITMTTSSWFHLQKNYHELVKYLLQIQQEHFTTPISSYGCHRQPFDSSSLTYYRPWLQSTRLHVTTQKSAIFSANLNSILLCRRFFARITRHLSSVFRGALLVRMCPSSPLFPPSPPPLFLSSR
jgi:hypothetical protein